MSKQLYEEALADAKKLKEVAEDNAKKSLIEAVTPRIRDLIERELLKEFNESEFDEMDCDDDFAPPGAPAPDGKLMTDIGGVRSPVSPPGPDGKVTLDLDALSRNMGGSPVAAPMFGGGTATDDEYMLEPDDALKMDSLSSVLGGGATYPPTSTAAKYGSERSFVSDVNKFETKITKLHGAKRNLRESKGYINEINSMIAKLDNMYAYVQESIRDSGRKKLYETRLELFFAKLKTLQEQTMRNRRSLNETQLVINMPEPEEGQLAKDWLASFGEGGLDAELDMGGSDEDEEDMDVDMEDEGGEEDEDEDSFDLAGDDEFGDEDEDEGGDDEFGDEDEEEDDEEEGDMQLSWYNRGRVMESRRNKDNLVVEIDEGMLRREIGRMREARQLREARALRARRLAESRRRRLYEFDAPSADGHGPLVDDDFGGDPEEKIEPLKVKLQEYDILEIVETGGSETEGSNAKNDEQDTKEGYGESYRRGSRHLTSRNGGGRNGTPSGRTGIAETKLRRQLEETNLFNAKLIYSNKLLQNESLSRRQKAEIIERLDEAKTLREAKLVYESLTKAMAGTSRPLRETTERRVLGSSSMTTRPASTQLNEGFETDRWARLAGITK